MKKLILFAGVALLLAGCAGGPPVGPPDPGGVVIVNPPYCDPWDPYCVRPVPVPPPYHPVPRPPHPEPHPPFNPGPGPRPGPGPVHRDVPADADHGDHQQH
jgi:hypothetical protein